MPSVTRKTARTTLRRARHQILGPHLPDPTRGWRGIAPAGLPNLRLALYADCGWREMEHAHGTYTPPGWPRAVAERLVAQGIGLEISVVTVASLDVLPGDPEALTRWLRLSAAPHAIIAATGSVHYSRRLLPSNPFLDRLRTDVGRRMGRYADLWQRASDPIVKTLAKDLVPYQGPDALAAFLATARATFPQAPLGILPVPALLVHYRGRRATERRLQADVRATAIAGGAEVIEVDDLLAPHGARARGANRLNLNALGSRIVGEEVARWLLSVASAPEHAPHALG